MFVVVNECVSADRGLAGKTAFRADHVVCVTACRVVGADEAGVKAIVFLNDGKGKKAEIPTTDSFDDVMAAIHDVGYCVVDTDAPRAAKGDEP